MGASRILEQQTKWHLQFCMSLPPLVHQTSCGILSPCCLSLKDPFPFQDMTMFWRRHFWVIAMYGSDDISSETLGTLTLQIQKETPQISHVIFLTCKTQHLQIPRNRSSGVQIMHCFNHWEKIRAKGKIRKSLWDFTGPQEQRKRGWPDIPYGTGRVTKICPGDEGPIQHSAVMIQEPMEYVTIYLDCRGMNTCLKVLQKYPALPNRLQFMLSLFTLWLFPFICSSRLSLRGSIISALQSCCPKNQPCGKASPQAWQAVLHRPLQLREAWLNLCLPI